MCVGYVSCLSAELAGFLDIINARNNVQQQKRDNVGAVRLKFCHIYAYM